MLTRSFEATFVRQPVIGFSGRFHELYNPPKRGLVVRGVCVRPDRKKTRFQPLLAQIKREHNPGGLIRLVVLLTDLVFQSLDVIQILNSVVIIRLESEYGDRVVQNGHSLLPTKLRSWALSHKALFEKCATELAWCLDNYRSVGAEHSAMSSDTMNGFFVGPVSVSQILDHLFMLLYKCYPGTEAGKLGRDRLLHMITSVRYERHDRLIARFARVKQGLAAARRILEPLKPGTYMLNSLVRKLQAPILDRSCKEAFFIVAAARLGIRIVGEEQLMNVASLLQGKWESRDEIMLVGPAIVPRRLWDFSLPYVSVDRQQRTMRGPVDQLDWLVTSSYSGVSAGFSRLYGSRCGLDAIATGVGVVRELYRPTVASLNPSEVATLEWIVTSGNVFVMEAYTKFRNLARSGYGPHGRESAAVGLYLYEKVCTRDQNFADGLFSSSMSLGAINHLAVSSDSVIDFCEDLFVRVIAVLSTEQCLIQSSNGDVLEIQKECNGNVVLTSLGGTLQGFFRALAERLHEHCSSRGIPIRSNLGYGIYRH